MPEWKLCQKERERENYKELQRMQEAKIWDKKSYTEKKEAKS